MRMTTRSAKAALLLFNFLALATTPAPASLFSLAASGTISSNSSGDATIPVGVPWTFEIIYNAAAPDLDFELTNSPDPTFGRFKNIAAPPALIFFHYQVGSYEVTVDNPADFGAFSEILVTFTSINALDINIRTPGLFPPLAGGPVSFHADFNCFTPTPIFSSDGLPTNTALGPESFNQSSVTLLPTTGAVSSSIVTSLTLTAAPTVADFDEDGDVDGDDLARWRSGFGAGTTRMQGDADSDGDVDGADFLIWQQQLGTVSSSTTVAMAPEPAAVWMLICGLSASLSCRRGAA